jgi:hypothetical protein
MHPVIARDFLYSSGYLGFGHRPLYALSEHQLQDIGLSRDQIGKPVRPPVLFGTLRRIFRRLLSGTG